MTSSQNADAIPLTRQWLEQVVIGLGLCPFARQPVLEDRVRIQATDCMAEVDLLAVLHDELMLLDQQPVNILETTLLIAPNLLADFSDYNQFLDRADALLAQFNWLGKYQIASFHPQYCFADVAPEAAENLTSRSPFPTFHLIREDSLTEAISHFIRPEDIPLHNIRRVNALSSEEKETLFPWIFTPET